MWLEEIQTFSQSSRWLCGEHKVIGEEALSIYQFNKVILWCGRNGVTPLTKNY